MIEQLEKSHSIIMNDDKKIRKIGIAIVMFLFSWLIVPMILYQGYFMRILKETHGKDINKLPKWNDPFQLLIYGTVSILFILIVNLPGTVMSIIPVFIDSIIVSILIGGIGSILSIVTSYILFCLLVIGLRDGVSELSNIDRIIKILKSEEYIINVILVMAIGAVFGFVFFILFITIIGIPFLILIIPIFAFYINLIMGLAVTASEENNE